MARLKATEIVPAFTGRCRKFLPVPAAEQFQVVHRCSRSASCPCATYEIALCAGSGCPACDRKLPGPPTPVAVAPMRDPCHGSNGKDLSWEPLRPELVVQVAYD